MSKKIQVQKQNSLVNARYRLSLHESWIFNYGVAKTNFKDHCYGDVRTFTISELAKFYDIDMKYAYKEFKQALKELFSRECTYYDSNLDTFVTCRLITEYHDNKQGVIAFKFSDQISELIATDKNFLAYKLAKTKGITSPTAIRIYEILLNRLKKNHKKVEFSILEFKNILGFEKDEYKRFADFNRRVLKVAQKLINENKNTDITFEYKIDRVGRVPDKIIFITQFKSSTPLVNSDDENIFSSFGFEELTKEDRVNYIKYDLKEYINLNDFMIKKYIKDFANNLEVLENQIKKH